MEKSLIYQLTFVATFLFSVLAMKGISILSHPRLSPKLRREFFMSSYLSVRTLKRTPNRNHQEMWLRLIVFGGCLGAMTFWCQTWEQEPSYFTVLIFSLAVYFLTECLGALGLLVFSWKRAVGPSLHRHPLLAQNLADFWGNRWNVWVQDWLKDAALFFPRNPRWFRILGAFCFSGLFHELMVNFPYWLVYRQNYFGNMMLYFCVQAAGLLVDKKFLRPTPAWFQRVYLWALVFLPVPLFVAKPFVTFFGMKHG